MNITDLTVMQGGLRNFYQIQSMVEHVKNGGHWGEETRNKFGSVPIAINRFEDDRLFLHDGHHRVTATFLAGRMELEPNEYIVRRYNYSDYLEINFGERWVTPFDPRTELRLPDISEFKKGVLVIAEHDEKLAIDYIRLMKSAYCQPRVDYEGVCVPKTMNTIEELACLVLERESATSTG